jgi:hypothetical protein
MAAYDMSEAENLMVKKLEDLREYIETRHNRQVRCPRITRRE